MFLHIKKTTWTIGKFYKIIIICYDNIFRKWNKTSADRLVCCSKDSPASQTYFAREPILMMSGRGLPRGRRTKTKTIAALRLCLFLIFLFFRFSAYFEYLLVLVLSLVINIRIVITLAISDFLMSSEKGSNVRRIMCFVFDVCWLLFNFILSSEQGSSIRSSMYFDFVFQVLWLFLILCYESSGIASSIKSSSSTHLHPSFTLSNPSRLPICASTKSIWGPIKNIYASTSEYLCPTKMYFCFFQKVFVVY